MKSLMVATVCLSISCSSLLAEEVAFRTVEGADGVPIHVSEWGNLDGPDILFIHGYQQSYLSWIRQINSDLSKDFHLVAYDLRGHGGSGKPWEIDQYTERQKWADDTAAVIAATQLEKPVIVAWSFGGVVLGDYVRHYGTSELSGINIVGTDGHFVKRPPLDPEIEKLRKEQSARTASDDFEVRMFAIRDMVDFLTFEPFDDEWAETVIAYNAAVPTYAVKAMSKRSVDNTDIVEKIEAPVLISWGTRDSVMNDDMAQGLADSLLSEVSLSRYEKVAHSPFYEDSERFNKELADFVKSVQ